MADKLLIRMFDVGLGDCIYCRIPHARNDGENFHMLVDCGSLSGMDYLKAAVASLKELLPDAPGGKKHLDLLVVTHEHKDHMAGFGEALWEGFTVGAIWMSAAMNPDHPEAAKAKKLHSVAVGLMQKALQLNVALSPEVRGLVDAMSFSNDEAMRTLRDTLPKRSGITPVYVDAGSPDADLALPLKGATLRVLGPEKDIDFFYLGKDGDPSLRGIMGILNATEAAAPPVGAMEDIAAKPGNLDPADFRQLRKRMQSAALAFADLDGKVTNNTSVVLLLEWQEKRLLFVGDAEWDAGFKEGKGNSSWNVMWNKRQDKLTEPVSFLKIGHHGSTNATPWTEGSTSDGLEPGRILDSILPVSRREIAKAVVSTHRGNYPTIPCAVLLLELGKRVANTRNYQAEFAAKGIDSGKVPMFEEHESRWFARMQPMRTDLESMLGSLGYIDVEIDPG